MRSRWHFLNVIRNLDTFGKEVPAFNIDGETKINTIVGGILTALIFMTGLLYAGVKLDHLLNRDNPNINFTDIEDYFSLDERLDLNEIGFKIAWSVEGNLDNKNKNDSRYVKWLVRFYGKEDGVKVETVLPVHKCTEEDYEQFSEIEPKSKLFLEKIKSSEDRGLYCIDW